MPPVRKFTPFAEREIERVVSEFIRQGKAFTEMGFLLNCIRVSGGKQDSK